ncbi:hypothetical protein ACO11K_000685 [Bacillus cytotoxicus]
MFKKFVILYGREIRFFTSSSPVLTGSEIDLEKSKKDMIYAFEQSHSFLN